MAKDSKKPQAAKKDAKDAKKGIQGSKGQKAPPPKKGGK
jgi:hypothetical protein